MLWFILAMYVAMANGVTVPGAVQVITWVAFGARWLVGCMECVAKVAKVMDNE